jgi:hypothetical protein
MKSSFVIDIDDDGFVRVLAVTQSFDPAGVVYRRRSLDDSLVKAYDLSPKFYGQLDALLITPKKIREAAPLTPESIQPPLKGTTITDLGSAERLELGYKQTGRGRASRGGSHAGELGGMK